MPRPTTCHHVLASGALCQAAALRNRDYCRFHLEQIGRRMKAARARARHQASMLKLPLLEDLYSVQVALMQLADAIAYREIDPQYARLLTSVLRLAMQNLKSREAWDSSQRFQLNSHNELHLTKWDTFEREYDLPADLDLGLDPEVAFPPIEEPTGAPLNPGFGLSGNDAGAPCIPGVGRDRNEDRLRSKIGQVLRDVEDAPPPLVTADSVELMEIYDRDGQEAARKFADQMVRNDRRRERRLQRVHYEEVARKRNIQLAAERLLADRRKAEAAAKAAPSPVNAVAPAAQSEAESSRKPPQSDESMRGRKAAAVKA